MQILLPKHLLEEMERRGVPSEMNANTAAKESSNAKMFQSSGCCSVFCLLFRDPLLFSPISSALVSFFAHVNANYIVVLHRSRRTDKNEESSLTWAQNIDKNRLTSATFWKQNTLVAHKLPKSVANQS